MARKKVFPKYRIERHLDQNGRSYLTKIFDVDNGHELKGVQKVKMQMEAGDISRITFTIYAEEVEVVNI